MSPLETSNDVERLARRLDRAAEELAGLDQRLRAARWQDDQLEDLELASALLRQAKDLLMRHSQRWRRGGDR